MRYIYQYDSIRMTSNLVRVASNIAFTTVSPACFLVYEDVTTDRYSASLQDDVRPASAAWAVAD